MGSGTLSLSLSPLDSLSERLEQQVTGRRWELSGIANLVENAIPPFCSCLQCLTVPRSRRSRGRDQISQTLVGRPPTKQMRCMYIMYRTLIWDEVVNQQKAYYKGSNHNWRNQKNSRLHKLLTGQTMVALCSLHKPMNSRTKARVRRRLCVSIQQRTGRKRIGLPQSGGEREWLPQIVSPGVIVSPNL